MGTDSVSTVNLSGDEHSVCCDNGIKPKKGPKNDFLSTLNQEFEKSKVDLLDRFLVDQAELNRRFGKTSESEIDDSESETRSDSSLKETENLLRQRLSLHQGFGLERARTSMGFYNQSEFRDAEKESDCSSGIDSADVINTEHIPDAYQDCEDVLRQLTVSSGKLLTLQTCVRPKTSVGKKALVKSHITGQDNKYSWKTLPVNRRQVCPSRNQMTLAFEEFQPCFVVGEKNAQRTGRSFRRHSEFSLGSSNLSSSSKLLRPVKMNPVLDNQKYGSDNVSCRNRNEASVGVPFSESDLQVVVPQMRPAKIYRPDVLIAGSAGSWQTERSCDLSNWSDHFEKSRKCSTEIREFNMQSNIANKNKGTSHRRAQPLTLVRLPPLKHTVARSPSGHKAMNPACY